MKPISICSRDGTLIALYPDGQVWEYRYVNLMTGHQWQKLCEAPAIPELQPTEPLNSEALVLPLKKKGRKK